MKTLTLFTAILCASLLANAQITFEKTYGGEFDDSGYSVLQTDDNGFIITGTIENYETDGDVCLIKTDENGNLLWSKTYGGVSYERGVSVHQTIDGGYFIVGRTGGEGPIGSGNYMIKTNEFGDTVWTKTYGEYYIPKMSCQSIDNGFVLIGTHTASVGYDAVFLMKLNEDGDSIWTRIYDNSQCSQYGVHVQQTNDNGFIITGTTNCGEFGLDDILVIRTNENGDALWTKNYGGTGNDGGTSIYQSLDDGYIISGYIRSNSAIYSDVYLIKTNENGDTLWTKTFGGSDNEFAYSMSLNNDHSYTITGKIESGFMEEDVYLLRTDENGSILWTKTFGDAQYDGGFSVKQTNDNGFIITGYTGSLMSGDVYLIKTDADGNVVGTNENLFQESNSIVFPNPGNGLFNIDLRNFDKEITGFEIYNVENQMIFSRNFNKVLDESIQVDLSTREKGIYLLKIQTKEGMEVKKLVVQYKAYNRNY
jgi:hypothetical protein